MPNYAVDPQTSSSDTNMMNAFRRYLIPILGVAETIATKGRSPGTTALTMEQNFQNKEDRRNKYLDTEAQRQADAIDRALRGKVAESQLASGQREQQKYDTEQALLKEFQDQLATIPEDQLTAIERTMIKAAGPEKGLSYLTGKMRPESSMNELLLRLGQQKELSESGNELRLKLQEENAKLQKELEGMRQGGKKEIAEEKKAEDLKSAATMKSEIASLVDEIENDPGFSTGLNPARIAQAIPGSKEFSFARKVENLKARLALNERQKLKGQGQISDKESKMLENAVSMLDLGLGKDAFMKELSRIKAIMTGSAPSSVPGSSNMGSGSKKFTIEKVE